jgi:hypothetical protein
MPLPWPSATNNDGNMSREVQQAIRKLLSEFADAVTPLMSQAGFPLHFSPLWRPWNLVVVRDSEKVLAAFYPLQGGIAAIHWLDQPTEVMSPASLRASVSSQLGMPTSALISLPLPEAPTTTAGITAAAVQHLREVERANRLGRLGDLTGISHLETQLRQFLDDHPDPDHNAFVMMRFKDSPQMKEIFSTIKDTCVKYGFHAVWADDRDYTGDLWSNIEVYMTCCNYGVAVFEDIDQRDFNPNVSLELGYMLGRRKRTLILKEQRLPNLPADVVHRLYKPFDMFSIADSVSREIKRWVEVDLGFTRLIP